MERDILFLLKEDFVDGQERYFCPDCAMIQGVLTYFPSLHHHLDIRYVDFARPRNEIVSVLDAEHQGCPVLILARAPSSEIAATIGQTNGRYYIAGAKKIAEYWGTTRGISRPH